MGIALNKISKTGTTQRKHISRGAWVAQEQNNCFRSHSLLKKYDPWPWKTHSKPKVKLPCYEKQEPGLDSTHPLAINAESYFAHPCLFSSPPPHTSLECSSPKSGEKLEMKKSIHNGLGMFYYCNHRPVVISSKIALSYLFPIVYYYFFLWK